MKKYILDKFNSKLLGHLKNRVVMSPMTRGFADKNHCCTDEISEYYVRRAKHDVGLIITEGIVIHPSADGYLNVPHMATLKQADSWRKTINGVHQYNSKIIAQLWHCGRISHPDFTGGLDPVSSTDIPAEGMNRQNNKPFGKPRALATEEITSIIDMHVEATRKALNVGFDAVQIHMGHGYLIDQFFDSRINTRDDKYGGSIENRCRFGLELIHKLVEEFGAEKIMIRISPSRFMNKLYEWPDLDEMLFYFINELNKTNLRMIDISCANANYFDTSGKIVRKIRELGWNKTIVGGASLTLDEANKEVSEGYLDLVTWGRSILANPDFVKKIDNNKEILTMTDEIRKNLY
jgi:N-ethylmaleimide reductase